MFLTSLMQNPISRLKGPLFSIFDLITGDIGFTDFAIEIFAVLSILLIIIPFHECAHAFAAKLLGDDTAERQGRLTLNPFVHVDPIGAFAMLLIGFGWGKPVPVNASRCNRKVTVRGATSLTAAAGPVSNVILSLLFVILYKVLLLFHTSTSSFFAMLFFLVAWFSAGLAAFNLIPIPPLDGSKILFFFLTNKQVFFIERNMHIISIAFMMLLLFTRIFSIFIGFVAGGIMFGLNAVTWFIR